MEALPEGKTGLDEGRILLIPTIVTDKGERVTVPLDPAQLDELVTVFGSLSTLKQNWLLIRFPRCESDAEACRIVTAQGDHVTDEMIKQWKRRDSAFEQAYTLLSSRCIDWARHLAYSIEAENAVFAAMEKRRLIQVPWGDLDGRGTTAKMQACSDSIDRVLGKEKQSGVAVILLTDLIPRRLA